MHGGLPAAWRITDGRALNGAARSRSPKNTGSATARPSQRLIIASGNALVEKWREAVAKQLLTPAPDLGAITWKRAKLKSGDFDHLPVKEPRVEQAIADDEAFLAAHPTRKPSGKPCKKPGPKRKTEERQDD
jgi:hypothetical protein